MSTNGYSGNPFNFSDTDQTVADPAADVRGRTVVDDHGEDIGKVADLLVDERESKVRFLRVGTGGLLGFEKFPSATPRPCSRRPFSQRST